MVVDVSTANGFTKFLRSLLDYKEMSEEEEQLWQDLQVSNPIVNNVIVTLPNKMQYNIQVKKVTS